MGDDDKVVPINAEAVQHREDMRRLAIEASARAEKQLQRRAAWYRKFDREMRFHQAVIMTMMLAAPPLLVWSGYSFWQGTYGQVDIAVPAECPNAAELRAAFDPFDGKKTIVFSPNNAIVDCRRVDQAEFDALTLKPGVSRGPIHP